MKKNREIGKYISILKRLNDVYFAKQLSNFQVGCGQQLFLMQIYKHPGMNLQELASYGHYDKATSTRAVKKLEEEGYVIIKRGKDDKRVRRIYTTKKAKPVVDKTLKCGESWLDIILEGLTKEEQDKAEEMLLCMASNAFQYINEHKGKE